MNTSDKNKNHTNMTKPCTRGNHAAEHEDMHLAYTRNSSESPDDEADETNEITVCNSIIITAGLGHPGYH